MDLPIYLFLFSKFKIVRYIFKKAPAIPKIKKIKKKIGLDENILSKPSPMQAPTKIEATKSVAILKPIPKLKSLFELPKFS